jgi:ATP-dependent Lhr-like helicase
MKPKTEMHGPSEAQIRATLGSVGQAFFDRFPNLHEVQRLAIPPIAEGGNILVCSATASGKTEAVIAPLVWRLRKRVREAERPEQAIRLLAVAPTRALVSDLLKRLDQTLPLFGWSVGAQTSDHSDASQMPHALVTTPESFDSMLVSRFNREHGEATDHLLAHVEAVFVDEAHLFDCSTRGDQVLFLLERLRRLRATAVNRGWTKEPTIQICGASATVSNASELAVRILGAGAKALIVPGSRELLMLDREGQWRSVDASNSSAALAQQITVGAGGSEIVRKLVTVFRQKLGKKVLIFSPSRSKCDELGEHLATELVKEVDVWVGAHHGSLSGERRKAMEKGFGEARGLAVLVATSTLEVGIDIGDVDVVGLIGPPPDVPALLQRIGRGGRRGDGTRVIPFAENTEHAAALGGMLVSAAAGDFDGGQRFRNWGVFAQQISSFIRQNGVKGRPRKSLVELAEAVWPLPDTADISEGIVDDLIDRGSLVENRSKFHLDGAIIEKIDEIPTSLHANIRSGGSLLAVRDQHSGEIIGHVSAAPADGITNVGGKRLRITGKGDGEIIVSADSQLNPGGARPLAVKYPTVPFLITRRYGEALAKGLGFEKVDAPLIDGVWWHFGGQAVEKLLRIEIPHVFIGIERSGLALKVAGDPSIMKDRFSNEQEIVAALESVVVTARSRYSRSSFDDFLSEEVFSQIAVEALQPRDILDFFQSRHVFNCPRSDSKGRALAMLLRETSR